MHLFNRKKMNFWAAVASLLGFPLAILGLYWALHPPTASSQSQSRPSVSTTGNQSPAIGSSGGDINIQYNSAPVKDEELRAEKCKVWRYTGRRFA